MPSANSLGQSKQTFVRTKASFFSKKTVLSVSVVLAVILGILFFYFQAVSKGRLAAKSGEPVLPRSWLIKYFGTADANSSLAGGVAGDPDKDGLINYQEYKLGTNPRVADSDGDGLSDGYEVAFGGDPARAETKGVKTSVPLVDPVQTLGNVTDELVQQGILEQNDVSSTFDLNRPLTIPEIKDSEIKIVPVNQENSGRYKQAMEKILADYNNGRLANSFGLIFNASSPADVRPVKLALTNLLFDLKSLNVPADQVSDHKTNLVYFGAMKKIVDLQERYLINPGDISPWNEIIYQSRILSLTGGLEDATGQ